MVSDSEIVSFATKCGEWVVCAANFFFAFYCLLSCIFPPFHSTEQVKVHLEEYFRKSQQVRGKLDQNLCLVCIQCFEVSNMCEVCVCVLLMPGNSKINEHYLTHSRMLSTKGTP